MTKSLEQLLEQVKPEVKAAAEAKAAGIIEQMNLSQARKLRGLNQADVAKRLDIAQSNISQIEARPDTLVSTLSAYIEALGGKLELRATFPDGAEIKIAQFKR